MKNKKIKKQKAQIKKNWKKNRLFIISSFLLPLVLIVLIIYFFLFPYLTQLTYSKDIPPLPDLNNQPKVLVDYLNKIHKEALSNPASDEVVGKLAMAYHANFFYDRAKVCYQLASELNSKQWRWSYYLALIKEELGDNKAVIKNLEEVVKKNPNITQAWFRLGNSYLKINSFLQAENAFNQVLKLKEFYPQKISNIDFFNDGAFPLKAYATLHLSRVAIQQKKYDAAKKQLERLIKNFPTFGSGYRLLGQAHTELENQNQSNKYALIAGDFGPYMPPPDPMFDELLLSSRNSDFIMKYVDIANKSQNIKWAVYLLYFILNNNPEDGEALTLLLRLSLDSASFDVMGPKLDTFYELYFSNEQKLISMANHMIYRGEYKHALKLIQRAVNLNPKSMGAHIATIQILYHQKQYSEAVKYCNKIISTEPQNVLVRHELIKIHIFQGKTEEAKQQLELAQELETDNATTWLLLAKISKGENNVRNAIKNYQKSVTADPNSTNTVVELGNYLLELQRWREAINHFQKFLQASPNDIDLNERYAWILATCPVEKLRNGQKALELAKRLSVRRTFTQNQGMRCGIVYAVALAEMNQFDQAIQIVDQYIQRARKTKMDYYVPRLNSLKKLFQSKKPFRL